MCSVNNKFIAVCLEGMGGGAFQVIPLTNTGRVDLNYPKVTGHTAAVLDVQFCPYNDNLIASSSDDCTVKIWEIPDGGLTQNLSEDLVTLVGHQRRVGIVQWHPLAENVIMSVGFDYAIYVWDIANPDKPLREINCHSDTIYSCVWNLNGSLIATTCKDKKLRIINPYSGEVVNEGVCHSGSKAAKAVFCSDDDMVFTTGFSRTSERQLAAWNPNDLSKPLKLEMVDTGSGVLMSHYDHDTRMVYIGGKGDGNIRFYECGSMTDGAVFALSDFKTSNPQRGFAFFPKTACAIQNCEVAKMIKLHPKGFIEVIGFTVPRKSTMFQDDIFPDTREAVPTLDAAAWANGAVAVQKTISLRGYKGGQSGTAPAKAPTNIQPKAPAPQRTSSAPVEADTSGAPKGEAALLAAWHANQKEITDLKKAMATLNIKLKAAMNSLQNQQ